MILANLVFAAVAALTQGDLTVKPNNCPKCPYRMRIAPDAKTAFINTARVSEADFLRWRSVHLCLCAARQMLRRVVKSVR